VVQECASRFSLLAAEPLAARSRALTLARTASPRHPLLTSSPKTRARNFCRDTSGQHPRRRRVRSITAPGSRACRYKTASGRRNFLNPDPSGFSGGLNFYAYANGNPVSFLDPFGLGAVGESGGVWSWIGGAFVGVGRTILGTIALANSSPGNLQPAIDFSTSMAMKYGLSDYEGQYGSFNMYLMMAGELTGTTPFAEGLYSVDIGTGAPLSSFQSGERTSSGGLQMFGLILTGDGLVRGFSTPSGVMISDGISGSRGTYYFGGFDPVTGVVYLGSDGHFGGMRSAGGTPVPGVTPGITVLETPRSITWANDSASLPRMLSAEQAAQVQSALEAQFPSRSINQVQQVP